MYCWILFALIFNCWYRALISLNINSTSIFPLNIVHINDFHARFEATNDKGGDCGTQICIGGYARTVYTVKRLLKEKKPQNPIYLNAGDSFTGTLWYNIGRWNVTSQFLNMLPADAMTLGNHEFDHGIEGVVPFIENLKSPMLVANMDSKNEPTIDEKYKKSMVFEKYGRKIGLIGVILETTNEMADTGKLIFRNESDAIREEAFKLKTNDGVNIIIVISHCGYDVDKEIARNVGSEIDVIVGAHSHTFLYTGDNPPGPDKPAGDYPTVVEQENGHKTLIVQAGAYAKYVGNLLINFDEFGEVVNFEGSPIYMGHEIAEDSEVLKSLEPWKKTIDEIGSRVIGVTNVDLLRSSCFSNECNLGNFFTDAMVYAFIKLSSFNQSNWSDVAIGFVNGGALRVPLYRGNITYSNLVTMSPFENVLAAFDLPGDKLLEALEFSVKQINIEEGITSSGSFLQVAGLKVVYNFKLPVGNRVVDVKVRCSDCEIPTYEPINKQKYYRIVAPEFLVNGGDGFKMLKEFAINIEHQMTDIDALIDYVETTQPITTGIEGRIIKI